MSVGRFAVIAIEYTDTGSGMKITIMTNAACHLWLRYSLIEPRTHKIPILRRGVPFRTDIRLCFVAYHDNEQSEAGDTWLHTFVKEPWPICQTRWFMFWGTINGEPSPSTSGIFKYHRTAPTAPTPFEKQLLYDSGNGYCQPGNACAQTFSPQTNHRITYLQAVLSGFPLAYCKGPYRVMLERYTNDLYPGELLAQVEDYWDPEGANGPATWYTWNIPPVITYPDDKLRLVIIGYGEWACFSGGSWSYGHAHINMLWWYVGENPYSRGCMQTGYNYDSNSGSYSNYADSDRTFVEGGFLL